MTPQQKLISDLSKRGQLTDEQWQIACDAIGQIQTGLRELEEFFSDND